MLFTSLVAVVAVSGLAPSYTPAVQPKWQPDYSTAVRVAAAQHKPLAVFVGHGPAGYAQLVMDGGPAAPTAQTLTDKFVALYVDADSPAGKPLAEALKVTDGVVISDHTAALVSLRHQGPVAPATLATYVTTYADERPVVQTIQAGTLNYAPAPVYAPAYAPAAGGCANGQCGRPGLLGGFMGNFGMGTLGGGGCPNGNCGGGRIGMIR